MSRVRADAGLCCLLGTLWLTASCVQAAETIRYMLMTGNGSPAGEQVVERSDDGHRRVRYVFKDNGRGPELEESIRLAPDGTLAEYEVKGLSEMGGPVDERFTRSGDQAQWRSPAEAGSKQLSGTAFYVPMNGSLEPASIGIAAAAASPNGTLALLPSGTLTQRKLDEVEVVRDGARQTVQLLALTGLWLTPAYHWATTGPHPRLFASIYPGWFQGIEEGWQGNLELLTKRQVAAEAVLLKQSAATLQEPLPGLTVVRNARVFDSVKARLGAPSDVYILRGRITAVLPAGSRVQGVARDIDAAGRVMLPGLFDMHAHVNRWDGALNLAAGVTTVRDLGSNNDELQRIIDEAAAGAVLMPHIVPAGFVEGDSPFSSQLGIKIKTLAEAKAAVDWYAQRGYPQIKIYNSFPREHLRETVAYAHRRGLRVSGHVPAFLRAHDVVAMGFDEVQHINQLMLTFLVTPKTDTRTLERFYLPAEKLARFDLKSKAVRDFITLLKKHGTAIDPTLATFDFLKQRDGEVSAPYAAVMPHLPPNVQRSFLSGGMKIPDDATAARYRASYDTMVAFVGLAYRAGIPIVAGTDAPLAGMSLHSELELYVKAGLTPAQALQVATLNGARYTRTLHERGSIEAGKLADLVLVDGDPTRDIADLRKVALVITQGKLIRPARLHEALGVKSFVAEGAAGGVAVTEPVQAEMRP
jgi:cytosine/adenosine deaminase-related metal-dependent hydrolase